MSDNSDTLLAQILYVVQEVQLSIESYDARLKEATGSIQNLTDRVDKIINEGFPRGDLIAHRTYHETAEMSW